MDKSLSSRYRILDTIRRHGEISRVELAARTELSRAAVTGITQTLLEYGLILEKPALETNGGARGRPRVMLSINPEGGHVLGIKLSLHQMSIAITDFKGGVVHSLALPFRGNQPAEIALNLIDMGVRHCLEEATVARADISGVCVGVPGYVSHAAGICHWSPMFVERDIALAEILQRRLGMVSFIENDANLVTLAEHWFGKGRDLTSFAVVTVEHGIGMGLVIDGNLYRGANGIGPELGHSKVALDGRPCRCGQLGCVEAYASDYAILRQALADFSLATYTENPSAYRDTLSRIAEQAKNGDETLGDILHQAGIRLGQAVANMIATLNPPTVIFTGEGLRAGDVLLGPAIQEAKRLKLSGDHFDTDFISHVWGDEVWAQGAAALMLQHIYADADFGAPV